MKVGFYFDTAGKDGLDCSNITQGNPGMGGSEYEFLIVSYLLQQRDNGIEPVLFTRSNLITPHKYVIPVGGGNLQILCDLCVENGVGLLVINQGKFDDRIFGKYAGKLSLILWAHNTMPYSMLTQVSKLPYVKRIVCCGREMLELFRDHPASLKSTYAYNVFPIREAAWYREKIDFSDNHNVVYMGMLSQGKGFHVLAKAWKKVLRQVPDAQLYVIGSGKLYDKNAPLGKYGLASPEFEAMFIPSLVDDEGKILPSVHFLGLLGVEKYEALGKCKVAVPNPTGNTECLPITTIEMQLMGCNITTIHHPAYLDTVVNRSWLYSRTSQLAQYIIDRLMAPRDCVEETYRQLRDKFNEETSIRRWEHILTTADQPMALEPCSENGYQMKGLKDCLLHAKMKCPAFCALPTVETTYHLFRHRIPNKIRRILRLIQ